jgi:hypothetical protein
MGGRTNQHDSTRDYSAAHYDPERNNSCIYVDRYADERCCPDQSSGETKTGSDDAFQPGSALKMGWALTTLSIIDYVAPWL